MNQSQLAHLKMQISEVLKQNISEAHKKERIGLLREMYQERVFQVAISQLKRERVDGTETRDNRL